MYFHGTPSCRLEPAFADVACSDLGVRLVSFDRPGYGESTPQPFGLVSIANATAAVADHLAIGRFATLGQSGGGPFSLACAAILGDRVTRAGVAAGAVPFTMVPGALDLLDENDRAALDRLPDREAAAAAFAAGFEPFRAMLRGTDEQIEAGLRARRIPRDHGPWTGPVRPSPWWPHCGPRCCTGPPAGAGTTWPGSPTGRSTWRTSAGRCTSGTAVPTGTCRPAPARGWPSTCPNSTLHLREGEGHLLVMEHVREIVETLVAE